MENKIQFGVTELSEIELRDINGGGFAHDVGIAIRFLSFGCGVGTMVALIDYGANKAICDCDKK